ncbi:kinetochore Sim4 complex subunit FTA2-domain-containing protein [Hypoxylon crocopeplum]|nr:kinetochore Sim4 complex subunit FTA2-domain-containing protein [Hypoxylon crocopeplum]
MYPDWPKSAADLVPLPRCDGPKLKPFTFRRSQKIEFLEYIGEGSHAHVFKVRIQEKIYALKLFRFVYDDDWTGPARRTNDIQVMSAFYNYSEPFSCECRAYGRLQDAGHEGLAIRCFGYLLLDEEHERTMMDQFRDLELEFNRNMDDPGLENMRSRFPGKDGRDPPIRGIVKEFGQCDEDLTKRLAKTLLGDIIRLQELAIINMDVAHRQVINGKLSDFSTAITIPHFLTSPELNPNLNSDQISAMEFETFQLSSKDYWSFDEMVIIWNDENDGKIAVHAFPGGNGCQIKYNETRRRGIEEAQTS